MDEEESLTKTLSRVSVNVQTADFMAVKYFKNIQNCRFHGR